MAWQRRHAGCRVLCSNAGQLAPYRCESRNAHWSCRIDRAVASVGILHGASRMNPIQPKSYTEIAWSAIKVFADDGTLDEGELNFLLGLALRDKIVDDDEKRVLKSIFDRAESSSSLAAKVRDRIQSVRAQ